MMIRNPAVVAGFAALALAVVGGITLTAVYEIGPLRGNAADAVCREARTTARRITPLIRGEVAALVPAKAPLQVAGLAMTDARGTPRTLADWRGRTVLLNLWATWCVPCRKEMPALDALQQKLGGPDFEVVAVNIDTRDPDKARAWWNDVGISHLAYYADPSAKLFTDLKLAGKAFGMPTTMLVDPSGCEIATIAGPAEWSSDDAIKLVSSAVTP